MKRINRQKFLAELGRLLTFMYEEDRQTALAMYNRMFDEAESEQALLQYLVSPTRQAVILARAYNAKERKLQVHAQSRDEYEQVSDETPDFVLAINKLQEEASALKITTAQVSEDQISLFDDGSAATANESAPAAQENTEPAAAEEVIEVSAEETAIEQHEESEVHEPAYAEPEAHKAETVEVVEEAEDDAENAGTVRKPIIPLLILYIIIAIPIGLIGILLLLLLALMSLLLAVTVGFFGIYGFAATFTGFAVLADILVVAGASLILLALALLFLWLFVWFIGGGIVGLIRGLCALGGSWCYKEVAVQ